MVAENVYQVRFDVDKALATIVSFERRVREYDARITALVSGPSKGATVFRNKVSALIRSFVTLENQASKSLEKIESHFKQATHAATDFRYHVGQASGKSTALLTKVVDVLRKIEKETSDVGKKVAKFLGPPIERSARQGQKAIDQLGRSPSLDRLSARARKAARDVERIDLAAKAGQLSLTGLAARIGLFVTAGMGIRETISSFLDFDTRITVATSKFAALDAAMLPGREGFKKLREEVRGVAREAEFSAASVAGAVDFWAKAGKGVEQTRAVIPITLDFASANTDAVGQALDMERAGDILSDTLGQFRLNTNDAVKLAENVNRISNVMTKGANIANFSAEELFESFKGSGPVLTAVGEDIEQTTAYLAAMANAGIKGSIAGRQLKIAVSALVNPTKRQKELQEKYNLVMKDEHGNANSLVNVIGQLDQATKNLGTQERFKVFGTLIGREGIASFLNLLAEGKANIDQFTQAMRDSSGETKRLADIARMGASKQLALFKNRLLDLGYQVIEETKLFSRLTEYVGKLDFKSASNRITKNFLPAIKQIYRVINNSVIPAIKNVASIVKTILSPALWIVQKLFWGTSDHGRALTRVLEFMIGLWLLLKTRLLALQAIRIAQYFIELKNSVSRAAIAQKGLNTEVATGTLNFKESIKQAGLLNSAVGLLGAAFAGWTIGSIIREEIIDPLIEAQQELQDLVNEVSDTAGRDLSKRGEAQLQKDLDVIRKTEKKFQDDAIIQNLPGFQFFGDLAQQELWTQEKRVRQALIEKKKDQLAETYSRIEDPGQRGGVQSRTGQGTLEAPKLEAPKVEPIKAPELKAPKVEPIKAPKLEAPKVEPIKAPELKAPKVEPIKAPALKPPAKTQNININMGGTNITVQGSKTTEATTRDIEKMLTQRDRRLRTELKNAARGITTEE